MVMMSCLELLKQKLIEEGYPVISDLQVDGEYHRFAIDGHKGQPGYYLIHRSASGLSAIYGDFVSGKKYRWISGNNHKVLTPEQAEEVKKQLTKEAKKIEAAIKRKHEKGAMAANFFWNLGENFDSHGYLESKKVQNHGLKRCAEGSYAGWLMVPGYNAAGELCTVQYINCDGQKRFETFGKKQGAFFEIEGDIDNIIIAEGYSTAASIYEATGHTVIVAFDAGNLPHVAKVIREKYPAAGIILAADNDQYKADIGNTGVESAKNAAIEIDANVAIPEFKDIAIKPTDFNDLAKLEGLEAVRMVFDAAKPVDKKEALKSEIEKIAGQDVLKQALERKRISDKYKVPVGVIDKFLKQLAKDSQDDDEIVENIEPASKPVNGTALLNWILDDLKRHCILPGGATEAITLWVLLTYCYDAFSVLPMLGITSPTKRCGKTTLLDILEGLICKGLRASNITAAAVYRTVEEHSPSLLIDEADTFIKNRDDLKGIINSGHTRRGASTIRLVGDEHKSKKFKTWCPKAIAMIGTLPDTIEDRCILIQLARKLDAEKTEKVGYKYYDERVETRSMCQRWSNDNIDALDESNVQVPKSGSDRADDNWRPLFTIAEAIGGDWPEKAKQSMGQLVNISDEEVICTKLLKDVQAIFEDENFDKIPSSKLVEKLQELKESPWEGWNRGRGLKQIGLAKLLKPFGVKPKTIRVDSKTTYKGYTLQSLRDAFERYIHTISTVTPEQTNNLKDIDKKQTVTPDLNVTDENDDKKLNLLNCYDVTDELEIIQGNKGVDLGKTEKWETGTI